MRRETLSRSPKDELVLHARLIPVARDLHVKAGERVIVVAGLVIGVYTGDDGVPLLDTQAPPKLSAVAVRSSVTSVPSEKKRRAHGPSGGLTASGGVVSTVQPILDDMHEFLRTAKQASTQELRTHTGVTNSDHQHNWRFAAAIRWLLKEGLIRIEGNRADRRYYYIERTDTP
jgi:hypothetical protein